MILTPAQRRLIRTVVDSKVTYPFVSAQQRRCIHELCGGFGLEREPEKVLVAFKQALEIAATEAGIPPGPERIARLARIVTVFIDEFYSCSGSEPRRMDASATR